MSVFDECTRDKMFNNIQLWYVCIEESEAVYIVYKDSVFTTYEKCKKLMNHALDEYDDEKVEICNFILNPIVW